MDDIDTSECWAELAVSDRFHRSLIRYFHRWILNEIAARGWKARDPEIFDQDEIDLAAWSLADTVMGRLKNQFSQDIVDGQGDGPVVVNEWLDQNIAEIVTETKAEYVKADPCIGGELPSNLQLLIDRTRGEPFPRIV